MKMGHGMKAFLKTSIAIRRGCIDMLEPHFHIKQIAIERNINLVFLPKYSPDLNPIEYIWKSIKRVVSRSFILDIDHMRTLIRDSFLENAKKLSFAGYWIERFLGGDDWYNKFSF